MTSKPWFNIVFMLIITAILIGALATVYEFTKPTIEANEELTFKEAYIYAFNLSSNREMSNDETESLFSERVEEKDLGEIKLYVSKALDGSIESYGFTFEGGALWGEVEGVLALSPDLSTLIGIDFIEQNETPGLGGRIDEAFYKEQFRNIQLYEDGDPLVYKTPSKEGQVDAITGATLTSNSIIRMLNLKIEEIKDSLGGVSLE